jgi:hypothetical protein
MINACQKGTSVPEAADLSYERLAAIRKAACLLADSGVVFIHERMHLTEIIARLDAGARLKHERDQDRAERAARSSRNGPPQGPHPR